MGQRRYQAFISYSHRDKGMAAWLHRALETYEIPANLAGTRTKIGLVPKRLTPIFKDREELPAAGSLGAAVDAALAASDALIVLCSPDAAASTWVNREIERFRELHGGGRIFAALARGGPNDAFPPALFAGQSDEPIAADLGPQGDGRKLAKLKLVAGLTGLDLDQLIGRDAQRKQQRLALVAAASLVGMIGTSTLAAYAINQRDEARDQRAEANGLVEYMLTDLRAKLEPAGKLEVLDSVGERALKYYSRQDLDELDANSLGGRAKAMLLVAEVADLRGNAAGAAKGFEEAARSTAELLRRDPDNWQRNYDHAQSEFWLAYEASNRGDNKAAMPHFIAYRQLAQRLMEIDPSKLESQVEAASADTNLGVALVDDRRVQDALPYFDRSMAVFGSIRPRTRDIALNLVNVYGLKASALFAIGSDQESIDYRQRQLAVLAQSPLNAGDREVQQTEAIISSQLASAELARGDRKAFRASIDQALLKWRTLTAVDRTNRQWLGDYLVAQSIDAVGTFAENPALARTKIGKSVADIRQLAAADVDKRFRNNLLWASAVRQTMDGQWEIWQDRLVTTAWEGRDALGDSQRSTLISALIARGDARPADAQRDWRQAQSLFAGKPMSTLDRINRARLALRTNGRPDPIDVALARNAFAGIFAREFGR